MQTSLREISSHGVFPFGSRITMLLEPLDRFLWASLLCLILIAPGIFASVLVCRHECTVSETFESFVHPVFWIVGSWLDQVEMPKFDTVSVAVRAEEGKNTVKLFRMLLFTTLPTAFVLNNAYRAFLQVGYISGVEYDTTWKTLSDVQNLTLYAPVESSKLSHLCFHKDESCTNAVIIGGTQFYKERSTQFCTPALRTIADGAYCRISTEFSNWVGLPTSCVKLMIFRKFGNFQDYDNCTVARSRLIFHVKRHWTLFPPEMMDKIVETKLTSPGAAMLTTKEYFPLIWPKFERAMKKNKSLVFKHNFDLMEDGSMPSFQDGIVMVSGLNRSYTALVAQRENALSGSGTWGFWRAYEIDVYTHFP